MPRILILFLLISIGSCSQNGPKKKDPAIARLTNAIIPLTNYLDDADSCRKALSFLDSATAISDKCFNCFYQKLMFLSSLKQYDRLFATLDTCISIKPNAHDLYLTAGIMREKYADTVLSKPYFKRSLAICNAVLDAMKQTNRDFAMLTSNKAINLIMLNDPVAGNKLLNELYKVQPDDPDFDNAEKKYTLSLMNKTKAQLLDSVYNVAGGTVKR